MHIFKHIILVSVLVALASFAFAQPQITNYSNGNRTYECSNHLGNVTEIVSDKPFFTTNALLASTNSYSDYYPYGMQMIGRNESTPSYRYGFQGQEKDSEVYGEGKSHSATFWQYDARLGRRWNRDPKPNPSVSEYACLGNNPIVNVDPEGDTLGIIVTSMAGKPGSGKQGHMAIIVGNDDLGYWVFSVENLKNKEENGGYVKEEEEIFTTDVAKLEGMLSGTKQAMLYGHKEETFDGLMEYISENAPGITNPDEHKSYGYDRVATYNSSSAELEESLINFLQSRTSDDFTYEVCSNNCASFSIESINEIFEGAINDKTWTDRPNKEFDRLKKDENWTVIKDEKESNDKKRETLNNQNGG